MKDYPNTYSTRLHKISDTLRARKTARQSRLERGGKVRYYFVYILTNNSGTLYTGVTNGLERRHSQHGAGVGSRFTSKYAVSKVVYYEIFDDIREAIKREKVIKGWIRAKKIALIEAANPGWLDLSEQVQTWTPSRK